MLSKLAVPRAVLALLAVAGPAFAQDARTTSRETLVTSARVERVDKVARMLTVRSDKNMTYTVYVAPELKAFEDLQSGDTVTVRFVDSVVAAVRPGAKPQLPADTTAAAQKDAAPGRGTVVQQATMTVTVESVDVRKKLVTYKTADNQTVTRAVVDAHLIDGLKRGDVVEVTVTRQAAIELKKGR